MFKHRETNWKPEIRNTLSSQSQQKDACIGKESDYHLKSFMENSQ